MRNSINNSLDIEVIVIVVIRYGNYLVSSTGRIFRVNDNTFTTKELKRTVFKNGYEHVTLFIDGEVERWKVHRLVATLFIPNPNDYPMVNHIDGDKTNNNVSNLEWATALMNNRHAIDHGLNNISQSNSIRWLDPDWAVKTRKSISVGRKLSKCASGKNNPSWRYRLFIDNIEYDANTVIEYYSIDQNKLYRLIHCILKGKPISEKYDRLSVIDTKR